MRWSAFSTLAFTLFLSGAALTACSGPAYTSPAAPQAAQSRNLSSLASKATPIPYTFQTIDDTASTVNRVSDINNAGEIVGCFGAGTKSSPYESYWSLPPYTTLTLVNYTSAQGTVLNAISSNTTPVMAGYVINPPQLAGNWGLVDVSGLFTLLKDHKEGSGKDAVTEINGVNASKYGAGFYVNPSGTSMPVVVNITLGSYAALKVPSSTGAQATGINARSEVAGWNTTTSGGVQGWFERNGSYFPLTYPGSAKTEALSLNATEQIVGFYTDSSGTEHGFVMSNPTGSQGQQVWQSIDEPNAAQGTAVTGINDSGYITGYYVDSSGVQHGFVGTP